MYMVVLSRALVEPSGLLVALRKHMHDVTSSARGSCTIHCSTSKQNIKHTNYHPIIVTSSEGHRSDICTRISCVCVSTSICRYMRMVAWELGGGRVLEIYGVKELEIIFGFQVETVSKRDEAASVSSRLADSESTSSKNITVGFSWQAHESIVR